MTQLFDIQHLAQVARDLDANPAMEQTYQSIRDLRRRMQEVFDAVEHNGDTCKGCGRPILECVPIKIPGNRFVCSTQNRP